MPGPGSRAVPKSRPSLLDKRDKKKAELAEERRVRAAVKKRDEGQCRVCLAVEFEVFTAPTHTITWPLRHGNQMHHITPRSLGGKHTTVNGIWICQIHHAERHAGVIRISGNGNGEIAVERIWR